MILINYRNTTKLKPKEQVNKPIFCIFECIYKARNQKPAERKAWLSLLRQMAKQDHSIGYLYLFYLANNPNKHSKIESSCYYEFLEVIKAPSSKEQLCQDMSVSLVDHSSIISLKNFTQTNNYMFRFVQLNVQVCSVSFCPSFLPHSTRRVDRRLL